MNKNTKPLKYIFENHFHQIWDNIKHKFPKNLHSSIWNNVSKFLDCGDISRGYTAFKCTACSHMHIVGFSCKSRFCSSCGKIYAESWALKLKDELLDVEHIHATFSLPDGFCRNFFFYNRHKLADLANAAHQSLKYSFKKLGIHSFGVIINIHTFSRNLDWNPHVHCIFTFGGYDKNQKWKNIKTMPYQVLRKSWQKCTLDIIAQYAKLNNNRNLKNKISLCYHKYKTGFYVNSDKKINNIFEIAKYIGRYLARPAIAEYRITNITDSTVTFWYQKPDSSKKIYLTLPIDQFIGRLLSHIPPEDFKMIRRFGLYSRRHKKKKPKKIKLFKDKISWAERIFKTFKTNPLICPKCNSSLVLLEIFHIKYGVIFPKSRSS